MTQPNLYARRRSRRIRPYLAQTVTPETNPELFTASDQEPASEPHTPLLHRMALGFAPTEEIPVVMVRPGVSWL